MKVDILINVLVGLRSDDGTSEVYIKLNGKEYPLRSALLICDENSIFLTDEDLGQEITCRNTRKVITDD